MLALGSSVISFHNRAEKRHSVNDGLPHSEHSIVASDETVLCPSSIYTPTYRLHSEQLHLDRFEQSTHLTFLLGLTTSFLKFEMHTVSGVNLHGDHPEKRPHSPEPEPPKKSAKTIKQCPICTSEVQSFPLSPESCGAGHEATSFGERACGECWEAHLGLQIQESPFGMVTCLFCGGFINEADLERLARKGTYER